MALSAGQLVSGYRIEKVLGAGGMGTVYLAANPVLPRSDALKVLSAELSQDPSFRARFIREADLAATLDHPNIVTVYTRGETEDGQLWIAMQYVSGSDAQDELDEGRMTARRAIHIVSEVGKALDYAHRRNLVHRDVKPANFLLATNDERVMLADFGIARALDDSVGLTSTGMVMATVAYAAPESLSAGNVDGRADIYALGCSLYRLLVGQAPFASSGSMAAVMAAHLSQPPPRVTDRVNTLPQAIDGVIARAMAKDPRDRYQTTREFALDAAKALEEPVTKPVSRPAHPTQQPAQPQWPAWSPQGSSSPRNEVHTYPSGYFSGPQRGPTAEPPAEDPTMRSPAHGLQMPPPPRTVGGDIGQPQLRPRWRQRGWIATALAAVVLIAGGTAGAVIFGGGGHGYQPQSFDTVHGTTQINAEPQAVAALTPGDADAVLSLGVQPVALVAPGAQPPEWERQLITGNPKLLPTTDAEAIAATKPDVIIGTADIDDANYNALTKIAPTVTRPQDDPGPGWTWQDRLTWIGRILGRDDKAKQLIDIARSQQDDVRGQHPAFQDKSVAAVNVSDDGVTATLRPSSTSKYLEGLGFRYLDELERTVADSADVRPAPASSLYQIFKADVLVVVRDDSAAGGGGYNGLPVQFNTYRGALVIVDDPNVITALGTGGYAANEYLNSHLVDSVAQEVH